MSGSPARFDGRLAVVTGGGGAIGRATALRLAGEGAHVVVVDRDEAAVESAVVALRDGGGRAVGISADVTRADDVERYASDAAELGGGEIDLLFNNAGIEGPIAPVV